MIINNIEYQSIKNSCNLIVTANEGDARDYDAYSEEARVKDFKLDTKVFSNAASLLGDKQIGRLKTTTALADTNKNGEFRKLFTFGGRSFSIFHPKGKLIYDSVDDFEQNIAKMYPSDFNSNHEENSSFDSRSDDKGPEPEALALGKIGKKTYAFIGLERVGGIMVYDITNPLSVSFVTYHNNRDFSVDTKTPEAGDLGVEGMIFVDEKCSPVKSPLVIASNEISGTVTIFKVLHQD